MQTTIIRIGDKIKMRFSYLIETVNFRGTVVKTGKNKAGEVVVKIQFPERVMALSFPPLGREVNHLWLRASLVEQIISKNFVLTF